MRPACRELSDYIEFVKTIYRETNSEDNFPTMREGFFKVCVPKRKGYILKITIH